MLGSLPSRATFKENMQGGLWSVRELAGDGACIRLAQAGQYGSGLMQHPSRYHWNQFIACYLRPVVVLSPVLCRVHRVGQLFSIREGELEEVPLKTSP